ncbi:MAG: (Fe-S)-binding protein [candidate division WOR-3 bacterium]
MIERVIFLLLFIFGWMAFVYGIWLRWSSARKGKAIKRTDRPLLRLWGALWRPIIQSCSIGGRRIFSGIMHAFIAWAFFAFVATVAFSVSGGLGGPSLHRIPALRHLATLLDLTAFLALIGVVTLAIRRFALRPRGLYVDTEGGGVLVHPKARFMPTIESIIVFSLIFLHMASYFLETGAAMAAEPDAFSGLLLPFSSLVASVVSGGSAHALQKAGWWMGMGVFIAFLFYMPHCKHVHLFFGPVNLFFRKMEPHGKMEKLELENENLEHFGAINLAHLPWKNLLDSFACIECGRCQDNCPAYLTRKPLSPKSVVENTRFLLWERAYEKPITEGVLTQDAIFSCTTCSACMEICPMANEPMMALLHARQGLVLDMGQNPPELNPVYKALEIYGNPWGIEAVKRDEWFSDTGAKRFDQAENPEYLLWEGCAGALDPRGQKIARAMVRILLAADVRFGVAGSLFKCNGDLARRTGNEYLFQMLAAENAETFSALGVRRVITICPHCYFVLRNEYPQFGVRISVIDHPRFILKLIQEGKISPPRTGKLMTYHDPCYLGRHSGRYDEPRVVLSHMGEITEMKNARAYSLCCGGGGGRFFMEERIGEKIYRRRTSEALGTRASLIATACPFCATMLEDGLKDADREDVMVRDVAELVADGIGGL